MNKLFSLRRRSIGIEEVLGWGSPAQLLLRGEHVGWFSELNPVSSRSAKSHEQEFNNGLLQKTGKLELTTTIVMCETAPKHSFSLLVCWAKLEICSANNFSSQI